MADAEKILSSGSTISQSGASTSSHVQAPITVQDEQRSGCPTRSRSTQISNVVAPQDDKIDVLSSSSGVQESSVRTPTDETEEEVTSVNEVEESLLKKLRKRYEILQKQLKKAKLFYVLLLVCNVILSAVCVSIELVLKDVCYSFIAVSTICALSTLFFKRGEYSKQARKVQRRVRRCCRRKQIELESEQSQVSSTELSNMKLDQEAAGPSGINTKDLPQEQHIQEGNLEQRPTENPPPPRVSVKVDVHGQSSSPPPEGACATTCL